MNPLKHIIPDSEEILFAEIKYGDILAFRNAGMDLLSYRFVTVTEENLQNLGNPNALYLRVKKRGLPTEVGSIIEARRIRLSNLKEPILLIRRAPLGKGLKGVFQTLDLQDIPGIPDTTTYEDAILDWREVDIVPRKVQSCS